MAKNLDAYVTEMKDFISVNKEKVNDYINQKISPAIDEQLINGVEQKSFSSFLKYRFSSNENSWISDYQDKKQFVKLLNESNKRLIEAFRQELKIAKTSSQNLTHTLKSSRLRFSLSFLSSSIKAEKNTLANNLATANEQITNTNAKLNNLNENYSKFNTMLSNTDEVFPSNNTGENVNKMINQVEYILEKGIAPSFGWIDKEALQSFSAIQNENILPGINLLDRRKDEYFMVYDSETNQDIIFKIPSIKESTGSIFNPNIKALDGSISNLSIIHNPNYSVVNSGIDLDKIYDNMIDKLKEHKDGLYVGAIDDGKLKNVAILEYDNSKEGSLTGDGRGNIKLNELNGIKPLSPIEAAKVFIASSELNSHDLKFVSKDVYEKHLEGQEINFQQQPQLSKQMVHGMER